jgi:hypothetical protein
MADDQDTQQPQPPQVESPLANGGAPTTPPTPAAPPPTADKLPAPPDTGAQAQPPPLPPEHRWLGVVKSVLSHLEGAGEGLAVGGVGGAIAGAVNPQLPKDALTRQRQAQQADVSEKQNRAQWESAQAAATWADTAVKQHALDQAPKAFQESVREKDQEQVDKLIAAHKPPAMIIPDDKPETLAAMQSELARSNDGVLPGIALFHYGSGYAVFTHASLAQNSLLGDINRVNKVTATPQLTPEKFNMLTPAKQGQMAQDALQMFSHPSSIRGEGPQQTIARYSSYLAKAQQLPDADPDKADLVKNAQDAVDMLKSGHESDIQDKLKVAIEAAKARGLAINQERIINVVDPQTGVEKPMRAGDAIKSGAIGPQQFNQIDREFIKPAADIELSYQKFLDAYKDYKGGAKSGAPSMQALAQHLASTIGSVKGMRGGEQILNQHVGARSVGDTLSVYAQKLSTGNALSANQWNDFKSMITASRRFAWGNAATQASGIGVDIRQRMPQDLGGKAASITNPAAATPKGATPTSVTPSSAAPSSFAAFGGQPRG